MRKEKKAERSRQESGAQRKPRDREQEEEEEREAAEEPGDKKKEEREQQEGTSEGRRKQEFKSLNNVGISARANAHDHIRAKLLKSKTIKDKANLQDN